MAKFLVTFNDTLDEIEINGFTIMSDKEVENFEKLASSINWPFDYKLGNDELEFSSGEDLLSRMEFTEITNEEAKVFKKLFNNEFGVFISESALEDIIGDEDIDDYDDDELDDLYDDNYDYNDDDND